ncbi:response regulator transcription factor [Rubrimonas cliftonensis]|uniref:Two component transcriptional regulator, LuxR family n=1 Tax=Rubrimonas cliftonensis TaxID=89524 RepID=A0A1H4FGS5_9RHOB|nr:response regulator transcription factor [Rubrimonas cliftonensis]SEA96475.1 two component transcriptional regulator, LuxR family [Rubrimonas cliftonensis]
MPSVLIIDDHPVVAEGWERIARASGACDVYSAASPLAGLRAYRAHRPDMIVLDLSFGDNKMAGVRLLRRLRLHDARTPVLVFSMHRSPIIARRALEAGCNGFVNKDSPPEEINAAFSTLSSGGFYVSPAIATRIAMLSRPSSPGAEIRLTEREMEILGMLAAGRSYREIASAICVSYKTVANVSHSLREKLKASSIAELVVKAIDYFDTA